jgi:hypothetical protein
MLAFGYPGNGKSAFAQRVANGAADQGISVIWIDVQALTAQDSAEVSRALEQVDADISESLSGRFLLVVNELDMLRRAEENNPEIGQLRPLVQRAYLRKYGALAALLVTATMPDVALQEVAGAGGDSEFHLFYLAWPSEAETADLLRLAGIRLSDQVAARLYALARRNRLRYTTGSIINGAFAAKRLSSDVAALKSMTAGESADVIRNLCTPTFTDDMRDYESRYAEFIEAAVD